MSDLREAAGPESSSRPTPTPASWARATPPRRPRPAVASQPGPARPCRLRYPKPRTHSSSAILSPVLRASETTEFGAAGLAGPAAASGFRCGQGRGLASQGDLLRCPLGGREAGRLLGLSVGFFRPGLMTTWPRDSPLFFFFFPVPGRERFGGNF